ncbi:hypothetical protein ACPYO6_09215 [Georgenia sp. Z1344]|uniref:hypothetical protein n=1 Tax=Georgenia sp. Z1344 TaxID=3416706 RepID=UPI003CF5B708
MTENAGTARRMRRPGWRDPRLGVGVLLVAASVGIGVWAVDSAGGTTEVWAAADVVTPGERLAEAGLEVVEVNVGSAGDHYLVADGDLPDHLVATRLVGAGELVPLAATGEATEQDLRPVVVPVGAALPSGLGAGSTVDLWRAPRAAVGDRSEEVAPPVVLAPEVLVVDIGTEEGVFAATGGASVELLVPAELVEDVLGAVAAGEELTVVPHHAAGVEGS